MPPRCHPVPHGLALWIARQSGHLHAVGGTLLKFVRGVHRTVLAELRVRGLRALRARKGWTIELLQQMRLDGLSFPESGSATRKIQSIGDLVPRRELFMSRASPQPVHADGGCPDEDRSCDDGSRSRA